MCDEHQQPRYDPAFWHEQYNDDYSPDAESSTHMVPTLDFRKHTFSTTNLCWCNPEYDEEHDMYIHNSADGSEDYEEGRRLPH